MVRISSYFIQMLCHHEFLSNCNVIYYLISHPNIRLNDLCLSFKFIVLHINFLEDSFVKKKRNFVLKLGYLFRIFVQSYHTCLDIDFSMLDHRVQKISRLITITCVRNSNHNLKFSVQKDFLSRTIYWFKSVMFVFKLKNDLIKTFQSSSVS
jgi:hypothetical protein